MTLGFPIWPQELLQAPLCYLRSFCFAQIRLDPLGGQVLHHDCISVIVSRFAIVTEDFVICCYQVTKIFSTRHGFAFASSARSPCNFGPLADLTISVFREVSMNTVFTQIHTSLGCGLWRYFMRRTGVWVSVFRNSLIHEIFCEFLEPPGFQNLRDPSQQTTGFTVLSWSPFYLFLGIFGWLGDLARDWIHGKQLVSLFYSFNMWTWHRHWMGIYPTQIFPFSSLTVAWHSCSRWRRRAWGRCRMIYASVLNVSLMLKNENWMKNLLTSLEPRSERSSPCYIVFEYRFLMRFGFFDRWSTRKNIRFHRKPFRATILLACSRGLSLSRTYPILWRTLWPLDASAPLHWLLWLT